MINPTVMKLKLELYEKRAERKKCELKIKRLIWELQNSINPFFKSAKEIKAEEIEQCAGELLKYKKELSDSEHCIDVIENQLGF
ncbi:MAG: hypothetical protein DKM22_05630 [Candidatus Melainabacteria bacterium]|nr:MAG: hypothetical protein DKM22_05630 [Candidatus Melainabacteria bacterium]